MGNADAIRPSKKLKGQIAIEGSSSSTRITKEHSYEAFFMNYLTPH
jgi:hypothetical protein